MDYGLCVVFTVSGLGLLFSFGAVVLWRRRLGRIWAEAGARLGLELGPRGQPDILVPALEPSIFQPLRGGRQGYEVELSVRAVTAGSRDNRRTVWYTRAVAYFPQSLWLGFQMRPTAFLERAWTSLAGEHDLQVGIPEIDRRWSIYAQHPAFALAMVRHPAVLQVLSTAHLGWEMSVSDASVTCEVAHRVTDPAALDRALEGTVHLASRFATARASLS